MKVEMPLSGRSFEQVSGWWSFKEDFISASFSTDRTRVFAYVGFETLGPTKKNGYNVDDASPALWRKLSLPDRERAFTSRIRQMAAVREVGNVQIATQRISTLFIQVEYTDEAGQAGLAKTLDRWQTHTLGDQDGDLRESSARRGSASSSSLSQSHRRSRRATMQVCIRSRNRNHKALSATARAPAPPQRLAALALESTTATPYRPGALAPAPPERLAALATATPLRLAPTLTNCIARTSLITHTHTHPHTHIHTHTCTHARTPTRTQDGRSKRCKEPWPR